jgi:hypothetical protein
MEVFVLGHEDQPAFCVVRPDLVVARGQEAGTADVG